MRSGSRRYQQTEDETERQAIKADLTKALQRHSSFNNNAG